MVVGGGLVGLTTALSLARSSLSITILEKKFPAYLQAAHSQEDHHAIESRPLSLSHSSYQLLKTLNIWPSIEKFACPIQAVHVSHKGSFGKTRFSAEEEGLSALGYVVPFEMLHRTLYDSVLANPSITLQEIEEIHQVVCSSEGVEMTFLSQQKEEKYSAFLLAACDGVSSNLRQLLNIQVESQDHQQTALTGKINLKAEHSFTAYERFTEAGILAVLPSFSKKNCSFVWTMPQTLSQDMLALSDQHFLEKFCEHFGYRLGKILSIERKKNYPLITTIANEQIRPSLVLLGNAAHTLYPIAAQGFNLALRDIDTLSQLITKAVESNLPINSEYLLKNYVESRKADQIAIKNLIQRIETVFGLPWPAIGPIKSASLLLIDFLSPLKHRLAKRALGVIS